MSLIFIFFVIFDFDRIFKKSVKIVFIYNYSFEVILVK